MEQIAPVLSEISALIAIPFIPFMCWVFWKSSNHTNPIYRFGMVLLIGALTLKVAAYLGVPVSSIMWFMEDVGIFFVMGGVGWRIYKARATGGRITIE